METRMLSCFHLYDEMTMDWLTQAIWDGNALVVTVTDGSVLNDKATYTIIIITDLDNENPTFAAYAGGKLPALANSLTWSLIDQRLQPFSQHWS
jgi:hypothetical protein